MSYLTAGRGWKTLLTAILVFEFLAAEDELLSRGMDRLLERHPVWPRLAVLAVALHLCNWLPEKIDPVAWAFVSTRVRRLSWPRKP